MQQNGKTDAHEADLRVRKTRKLLQDALVSLMAERSFDSITIAAITERAMVNRATFYRHYRDKYHLSETVFQEALETMVKTAGTADEPLGTPDPKSPVFQEAWASLFNHVADNERLYRTLFNGGVNETFLRHIREYLVPMIKRRTEARIKLNQSVRGMPLPSTPPATDLPYIFAANLLIGNLAWWLEEGRGYERDDVIQWTRKFMRKGFPGLLGD